MAATVTYTTINGVLYAEDRGGTYTEYIRDPLGSLVGCRDSAGAISYTAEYWPYGEVQTETGTNPSPWGFVGLLGYLKDMASLLYVRARYLQTVLGRWATVDPLWPGESAYGYAGNNPATVVDPSGLWCYEDHNNFGNCTTRDMRSCMYMRWNGCKTRFCWESTSRYFICHKDLLTLTAGGLLTCAGCSKMPTLPMKILCYALCGIGLRAISRCLNTSGDICIYLKDDCYNNIWTECCDGYGVGK